MDNPPIDMTSADRARHRLRAWLESAHIQNGIVALIVLNAILLGLETWPVAMARAGDVISAIDRTILGVFVVELMIRLYVHRSGFWRDPWSVFDFLVVAIALIPASGSFAVLRALRVLRVLRLLTMMPSMRRVVGALLKAIPGLSSIGAVLLIFYYVFAVLATNRSFTLYPLPDHDVGKLVDGYCTAGHGTRSLCLDIFHHIHSDSHVHHAQSLYRHYRQCHAKLW